MENSPWNPTGEPVSLVGSGGNVTLVEGRCFCLSSSNGDIIYGRPEGLFLLDTRLISRFQLSIGGDFPEPLSTSPATPSITTFTSRARPAPGLADSSLLISRSRYVGQGMREDIVIRNFSLDTISTSVLIDLQSDFADLFAVKDGRTSRLDRSQKDRPIFSESDIEVIFPHTRASTKAQVSTTFSLSPTSVKVDKYHGSHNCALEWEIDIPAHGEWSLCMQISLSVDGNTIEPRYKCGELISKSYSFTQLKKWRHEVPVLSTSYFPLQSTVAQALEDIGSLRIFDPDYPDQPVVAAGAPWFMTLFGRDSLISAWMSLTVDPDLARGVLNSLSRMQGTQVNPITEEEPGRILHEVRFDKSLSPSLADSSVYFGSIDSTPLFVMLLGELRRWSLAREDVDRLMPAADRALDWIVNYGDRDGDGYVEYQRSSESGLANQGWKDSWDSISFADGRLAEAPIALAEVQGYVYAAYRARAYFARESGDKDIDIIYTRKADDLRKAFNRDFWLDDKGYFAIGLDKNKVPIDSLASNMGHCLLTGIIDTDKASKVVSALMSKEMFSGWGVRTLATSMARYNPISYHNGSVWPHDSTMIAAGMVRYGYVEQAHKIILGLLDVASHYRGRLPELFGGISRAELSTPLSYPTSCSPQAWAAASPLLMLRTLLRFDPWIPFGRLWISPQLPSEISRLEIQGIPIAHQRLSISYSLEDGLQVNGATPGIEILTEARPPLGGGNIADRG